MTPAPAPGLMRGRTVHVRFQPFAHRLEYDLFQLLIDVDEVANDVKGLRWLTYNRFGPFAFYDRDHGDRSGAPLRLWVEAQLKAAAIEHDGGPIRLLTFPRVLGYVFNPLSVFFIHHRDGRLAAVIYEVNNTFGETHSYVAPATGAEVEFQEADKIFHVSPFFDVSGRYAFTLRSGQATLSLTIDSFSDAVRQHLATLKLRREALSDRNLVRAFFAIPLLTVKVILAIHWEALKLLLKGARYHHKPVPPIPVSIARLSRMPSPHE
ncbi:hypothetical protein PbB2_00906 [Candidatus Phycosocius bacilliformis]|uniref:DUF1365 domain-containing protein n=1 Tax=Candidatus Phycosocius bacilliformis TaxID=1445552 RepID=A0A2P2E853_9PROT|nr:DUF1365 domain-containing protein [Candidatus Phycosocius bacilliformis]GBF57241.1 hypothetical protein PbB2_00906 [Candidatus Phycosocius bacilliformis]